MRDDKVKVNGKNIPKTEVDNTKNQNRDKNKIIFAFVTVILSVIDIVYWRKDDITSLNKEINVIRNDCQCNDNEILKKKILAR